MTKKYWRDFIKISKLIKKKKKTHVLDEYKIEDTSCVVDDRIGEPNGDLNTIHTATPSSSLDYKRKIK